MGMKPGDERSVQLSRFEYIEHDYTDIFNIKDNNDWTGSRDTQSKYGQNSFFSFIGDCIAE